MHRVPSSFIEKFGHKLDSHLHLNNKTIVWNAFYDKYRKKLTRLSELMRFNGLKIYSILVLEYYGYGNFTVHCYNNIAISITEQTIDPVNLFYKEYCNNWMMDEFIYGRNHNET